MSFYVTTANGHRITARQAEALSLLISCGGQFDITAPPFLLGHWSNTCALLRRLSDAGFTTIKGNVYSVTPEGRKALPEGWARPAGNSHTR